MESTNDNKRTLFMPLIKSGSEKYLAVLSDNSIDRDNEIVSKSFLSKFADDSIYLPALIDHENKTLNNVAKWVNKRMAKVNGHDAFVAEPQWFLSNPNAVTVKGMLDDGAELGVSIGASVTKWSNKKIGEKEYRQFDEGEMLEASFTPIPANKNARALAVAKSFNTGDLKMEEIKEESISKSDDVSTEEPTQEPVEKKEDTKEDEEEDKKQKKSFEIDKSIEEMILKKVEIMKIELEKKYESEIDVKVEKKMKDRFEVLKKLEESDTMDESKQEDIAKSTLGVSNENKDKLENKEPTVANFIAANKGWKN